MQEAKEKVILLVHRISDVMSMEVESSEEEENVLVGMSEEVEESDMSMLLRCSWNCSMVDEFLTSLEMADGQASLLRNLPTHTDTHTKDLLLTCSMQRGKKV